MRESGNCAGCNSLTAKSHVLAALASYASLSNSLGAWCACVSVVGLRGVGVSEPRPCAHQARSTFCVLPTPCLCADVFMYRCACLLLLGTIPSPFPASEQRHICPPGMGHQLVSLLPPPLPQTHSTPAHHHVVAPPPLHTHTPGALQSVRDEHQGGDCTGLHGLPEWQAAGPNRRCVGGSIVRHCIELLTL